jgi:hypothetical protein
MQSSASWNRQTLADLYANGFDADDYIQNYYGKLDSEVEFFLRNLHDFFTGQGIPIQSRTKGRKAVWSVIRDRKRAK